MFINNSKCKIKENIRRNAAYVILVAFFINSVVSPVSAQSLFAGSVVGLPVISSPMTLTTGFQPPILLGLKVHSENPLLFDFIVDQGQTKLSTEELKRETEKLVKYFLAALTIPDQEVWVNLSPYEKDRIIPDVLGQTTMGKTMLEQDYLLKQMAASLTNPETELGKKYWDQVNSVTAVEAKAIKAQRSGENRSFSAEAKQSSLLTPSLVKEGEGGVLSSPNASIGDPLSTNPQPLTPNQLNKVWIMPAKAEVLESNGIVLVGQKRLKVMLAEDYEAVTRNTVIASSVAGAPSTAEKTSNDQPLTPSLVKEGEGGVLTTSVSTNIFRQTILPAIDKAVNESKDFAEVRQIYNSVILAAWYKKALKESLLGKVYADQGKVAGVETDEKEMKQRIYKQYLAAFKKGAYNLIKEEVDADGDLIPRKYFSGGAVFEVANIVSSAEITLNQANNIIEKVSSAAVTVQLGTTQDEANVLNVVGTETAASSTVTADRNIQAVMDEGEELISRIDFTKLNSEYQEFFGQTYREFKERNQLREERLRNFILSIGESAHLYAHGVESAKRGIAGIINIALEGRLRFGANYGLLRDGNAEYYSGPHGPYYAVLSGDDPTLGSDEIFRYFLFPDFKDKEYALAVVNAAEVQGVITTNRARTIESKMLTYEEFIDLYRPRFSKEFLQDSRFKLTQLEKVYLRYFAGEMAVMLAQGHYLNHSQGEINFSGKHFIETLTEKNYELDWANELFEQAVNKVFTVLQKDQELAKKYQKEIAEVFASYFWQVYHLPKLENATLDPDVDLGSRLAIRGVQRFDKEIAILGTGLQGFVAMTEYPQQEFLLVDQNPFIVFALRKYKELTANQSSVLDEDFTVQNLIGNNNLQPIFDRVILSRVLHEAGRTHVAANSTEGNQENEVKIDSAQTQAARKRLIQNAVALLKPGGTVVVREVLKSSEIVFAKKIVTEIENMYTLSSYTVNLNAGETAIRNDDKLTNVAGIVGTIQKASAPIIEMTSQQGDEENSLSMVKKQIGSASSSINVKDILPAGMDSSQPVEISGIFLDLDRTAVESNQHSLSGDNLDIIIDMLVHDKFVIVDSGGLYEEKTQSSLGVVMDTTRWSMRQRVTNVIKARLKALGQDEKIRHLEIHYLTNRGQVTFDQQGNETINEPETFTMEADIELEITRSLLLAFVELYFDQGPALSEIIDILQAADNLQDLDKVWGEIFSEVPVPPVLHVMGNEVVLNVEINDPESNKQAPDGQSVIKRAKEILKAREVFIPSDKYFPGSGQEFAKVSLGRKVDVFRTAMAERKPTGLVVGLGDASIDDFLHVQAQELGYPYLPVYLGRASEMKNSAHVYVAQMNGQNDIKHRGFAPVLQVVIKAARTKESYQQLVNSLNTLNGVVDQSFASSAVDKKSRDKSQGSEQSLVTDDILAAYGLQGKIKKQSQLLGGNSSDYRPVQLIAKDGKKYVVRQIWSGFDLPQMRDVVAFSLYLKEKGFSVPVLLSKKGMDGLRAEDFLFHAQDGKSYLIEEFMDTGVWVDQDQLNEKHFKAMGQLAARINNAVGDFKLQGRKYSKDVVELVADVTAALSAMNLQISEMNNGEEKIPVILFRDNYEFFLRQAEIVSQRYSEEGLYRSVIAGDLHPGNLTFGESGATIEALMDLDRVSEGFRIGEFNNMIMGKYTLNMALPYSRSKMVSILKAYNQEVELKLTRQEISAIVERMRLRFLREIQVQFEIDLQPNNGNEVDNSRVFSVTEKSIEKFKDFSQEFDQEENVEILAKEVMSASSATVITAGLDHPVGGINFDPTNMDLQIKRDGQGVPLPLPQQNLEQINIQGLFPVIINIIPMNAQTLPIFLGFTRPNSGGGQSDEALGWQIPKEPAREPELAAITSG